MTYNTFRRKFPMRIAKTECRVNLAIYIHARGNGFLIALGDRGQFTQSGGEMIKIPYRRRADALKKLDDLLQRAEKFARLHTVSAGPRIK